jgi:hypothetical protein
MTGAPTHDAEGREVAGPPATGNPNIDAALAGLSDLDSAPLGDHHDRLGQAQAALQAALEAGSDLSPRETPDSS